jgi:hypothetical protein
MFFWRVTFEQTTIRFASAPRKAPSTLTGHRYNPPSAIEFLDSMTDTVAAAATSLRARTGKKTW